MTTEAQRLRVYSQLVLIRRFEDAVVKLFQEGVVPGNTHLASGQEATAVGVCEALLQTDYVGTTHRSHAHFLAKGADPGRMLAEVLGRADGYNRGMGGELHMVDPEHGLLGANGIVGGGLPIMAGAAFAESYLSGSRVTTVFFGEGSTSEGTFNEALNMVALWKLPLVMVCENNLYAEYSPAAETVAGDLCARAAAFGITSVRVDGQDFDAVYEASVAAVQRARDGEGATFIEAMTYRFEGHTYGEEAQIGSFQYRDPEELLRYQQTKDPLVTYAAECIKAGITQDALAEIRAGAELRVANAVAFALASPEPDPQQAFQFVLSNSAS